MGSPVFITRRRSPGSRLYTTPLFDVHFLLTSRAMAPSRMRGDQHLLRIPAGERSCASATDSCGRSGARPGACMFPLRTAHPIRVYLPQRYSHVTFQPTIQLLTSSLCAQLHIHSYPVPFIPEPFIPPFHTAHVFPPNHSYLSYRNKEEIHCETSYCCCTSCSCSAAGYGATDDLQQRPHQRWSE